MLSLWCPLTDVTPDNGCMFVLPKEHDPLLHAPAHPKHLLPFDQHSGRCYFPLGGAVALAPCAPGAALAWHGSSVHWGGACSTHAEAEPRSSLTAVLWRTPPSPTCSGSRQRMETSMEVMVTVTRSISHTS